MTDDTRSCGISTARAGGSRTTGRVPLRPVGPTVPRGNTVSDAGKVVSVAHVMTTGPPCPSVGHLAFPARPDAAHVDRTAGPALWRHQSSVPAAPNVGTCRRVLPVDEPCCEGARCGQYCLRLAAGKGDRGADMRVADVSNGRGGNAGRISDFGAAYVPLEFAASRRPRGVGAPLPTDMHCARCSREHVFKRSDTETANDVFRIVVFPGNIAYRAQ